MSNQSLKGRIKSAIDGFESGQNSLEFLIDVVDDAGLAIEGIPYTMISEFRSIKSRLAIELGYQMEEVESKPEKALVQLKLWLEKVPS